MHLKYTGNVLLGPQRTNQNTRSLETLKSRPTAPYETPVIKSIATATEKHKSTPCMIASIVGILIQDQYNNQVLNILGQSVELLLQQTMHKNVNKTTRPVMHNLSFVMDDNKIICN